MTKPLISLKVNKDNGLPIEENLIENSNEELLSSKEKLETESLLSEVLKREEELRLARENFEEEKLSFEKEYLNRIQTTPTPMVESELVESDVLPTMVRLKTNHVFQAGMPSRPEILVTHSFKENQIVKDESLIALLIETAAPITVIG